MEEKQIITVLNEEGRKIEVEVVAYFTLNSNNKKYLIYTENAEDESGNVEVYTSEVIENEDGTITLESINDEETWTEIKKVMVDIAKNGE